MRLMSCSSTSKMRLWRKMLRRNKAQVAFVFPAFVLVLWIILSNNERDKKRYVPSVVSEDDNEVEGWGLNVSKDVKVYSKSEPKLEPRIELESGYSKHVFNVLIVIHSAPQNYKRRNMIRNLHGFDCKQDATCDLIFILGRSDSETEQQITMEHEEFQDILVENFIDSYNNLTLKSYFMLNFFAKSPFTHLFKTDDDCFVNIVMVKRTIIKHQDQKGFAMGYLWTDIVPNRNFSSTGKSKKWYMPKYLFDRPAYPPYFGGPGYLLTKRATECLLKKSQNLPVVYLEDIYWTGIVLSECKDLVEQIHHEGFSVEVFNNPEIKFEPNQMVLVHLKDPDSELPRVWKKTNRFFQGRKKSKLLVKT